MKNGIKIAFVYIGLVIGAGFASGREIIEYFNTKSQNNPIPVLIAFLMFLTVSYLILNKARREGISDFGEFVDKTSGKASKFIKTIMYLFMFSGFFVMLSAGGALLQSAFSCSDKVGVVALSLICFLAFSFDIKGIVAINTILVPFMVCGITYLSVSSLLYNSETVSAFSFFDNPYVSAVCYVSYNTITAGAVLVPLYSILDKKSVKVGAILGSAVLGILIFLIREALNIYYDRVLYSQMPLFDMAVFRGKLYKYIYLAVLFTSICTTAVSHGFGILSRFHFKTVKERVVASGVFCLVAMPFSDLNFAFLVSSLYMVFGYFGLIWLIILLIRK